MFAIRFGCGRYAVFHSPSPPILPHFAGEEDSNCKHALAAKGAGEAGAAEAVRPDVEADAGGGHVCEQLKAVAVQRVDGEDVAVRTVAGRRAGAAIVVVAVVVAGVARTGGQAACGGVFAEAARIARQVDDVPVLEAGAGRRVRIVAGKGEALGARGRVRPMQFGRVVLSASVGVNVRERQGGVIRQGGGGEGEGHGFSPV